MTMASETIRVIRKSTLDAVDAWLKGRERYFWLEGQPGAGKSVIATMVSEAYRDTENGYPLVIFHACDASSLESTSPQGFIKNVAKTLGKWQPFNQALINYSSDRQFNISVSQVIENAGKIIGVAIENLLVGSVEPEEAFLKTILEPLSAALTKSPRPILFIVDGLDESIARDRGSRIAQIICALNNAPDELRFLITSRPEERLQKMFDGARIWRLDEGPAKNDSDAEIAAFVKNSLLSSPKAVARTANLDEERLTNTVVQIAQGNFLIARFLIDNIIEERAIVEVDDAVIAPSLNDIYMRTLDKLQRRYGEDNWRARHFSILCCLSVAYEPLSEHDLAMMTNCAVDHVHSALFDLWQILKNNVATYDGNRRFSVFHRSLADFLLDANASKEYWCSKPDQHRRIVQATKGTNGWQSTDWDTITHYLLRYLPFHIAAQHTRNIDDLDFLLDTEFLEVQYERAGPDFALQSLQEAISACARKQDLDRLFRFSWLYAVLRDLLALSLSPARVEILAELGQVDGLLSLVDRVESFSGDALGVLVAALARAGRVDEALQVATVNSDAPPPAFAMEIALSIVESNPTRALQIAPQADRGFFEREETKLCTALARKPEFETVAIERARHTIEAIIPVALEVAQRDWRLARRIIRSVPYHRDRVDGVRYHRTSAKGIADLAILMARRGRHDVASMLLDELHSKRHLDETGLAAVVMVEDACKTGQSHFALHYLEQLVENKHPYFDMLFIPLAVSSILARKWPSNETDLIKYVEKCIGRLQQPTWLSITMDEDVIRCALDLFRRLDLEIMADHPKARDIALSTIMTTVEHVEHVDDEFTELEEHYSHLGFYWGTLDLADAVTFAVKISNGMRQRQFGAGVVAAAALHDLGKALALANGALFNGLDFDYVLRRLSRRDWELALQLLDHIPYGNNEHHYRRLLMLLESIPNKEPKHLKALQSKIPRYTDTSDFRYQSRTIKLAAARQIALTDRRRGLLLAREALEEAPPDDLHLFELDYTNPDGDRALQLILSLEDEVMCAKYLIDIFDGKHNSSLRGNWSLLEEATKALESTSSRTMRREHLMARLIKRWIHVEPEKAVKLAAKERVGRELMTESVSAAWTELPMIEDRLKARLLFHRCAPHTSKDAGLGEQSRLLGGRRELIVEILCKLDKKDRQSFFDWLGRGDLTNQILSWRCRLRAEPGSVADEIEAALMQLSGDDFKVELFKETQRLAFRELANQNPDRALSAWRAQYDLNNASVEFLALIVASICRDNLDKAIACAAEAGPFRDDTLRWAAQRLIDEPRLVLRLAQDIRDDRLRGVTLAYALEHARNNGTTYPFGEQELKELLSLAQHIPVDERNNVLRGLLAYVDKETSNQFRADILHFVALLERQVFLEQMIGQMAHLTGEVVGGDTILEIIETVRGFIDAHPIISSDLR